MRSGSYFGAGDKSREFFISRELAEQVIDALPDAQWRLMFALARYGRLRCPLEVLLLRWGDIDWERGRMLVTRPKTEHHEGGKTRLIPIFSELRPYMDECFELAPEGAEYVISRYHKTDSNDGVLLGKLVRRAGIEMWSKPWQNLRSTCETELAERFPMHVVCGWIGNSQLVAAKHYLQVTDDHFADAARLQSAREQMHATAREPSQIDERTSSAAQRYTPDLQGFAADCDSLREIAETGRMGVPGLENSPDSSEKTAHSGMGAAPGAALDVRLDAIIEFWTELPEAEQQRIADNVQARLAKHGGSQRRTDQ